MAEFEQIKKAKAPGGDVEPLLEAIADGEFSPMEFFAIAVGVCRSNPEKKEHFLEGLGALEDSRFSDSVPLIREQLKIGTDGRHSEPGEIEFSDLEGSGEIVAESNQPWENLPSELDKFFAKAFFKLVELYADSGHCAFLLVSLWSDSNRLFLWEHPEKMDHNGQGKGDLLDWCLAMRAVSERKVQLAKELKQESYSQEVAEILQKELWVLLRDSIKRVIAAGALDGLDPKPRLIGMVHAYYHAAFDFLSGEKMELPLGV